jgi:hypothetical protein
MDQPDLGVCLADKYHAIWFKTLGTDGYEDRSDSWIKPD